MPIDPPARLTCRRDPAVGCPSPDCPGTEDPAICHHVRRLGAWRLLSPTDQAGKAERAAIGIDPAVRDAINACPDRGPVLPISAQDDCGCRGREVSLCRAGRGASPGRVTLRDCLDCRGGAGG